MAAAQDDLLKLGRKVILVTLNVAGLLEFFETHNHL